MQEAWGAFCTGAREGKDQAELLNELGLTRYCCRRMILTQPLTLRHDLPHVTTVASEVSASHGVDASPMAASVALLGPKRKAARKTN